MVRDVATRLGLGIEPWPSAPSHTSGLSEKRRPRSLEHQRGRARNLQLPLVLTGSGFGWAPSQRQSAIAVVGVIARICRAVERMSLSRRSQKGKFNHRLGSLDKLRLPGRARGVLFWKIHRPANGLDSTIHAGCGSLTPVAATSTLQRWCRRGGRDVGSWNLL